MQPAAMRPRGPRKSVNTSQHAETVPAAISSTERSAPPPTQPAHGADSLEDIPGAVAAGWREYTNPVNGHAVFVNDVTYEEAKNLVKVADLMRKLEQREAKGIHATGRRLSEIDSEGMDLVVCRFCSRKFNPQSIQRHEQICEASMSKKHKVVL